MRLWRISDHADLSGEGGRRYSARWHNAGRAIVYCADHPAGTLVEILAHVDWDLLPDSFQLLTIEIDESVSVQKLDPNDLPVAWKADQNITQAQGNAWLASGSSLLLHVPSAIMPDTWNVLFNPFHGDAGSAKIVKAERFPLDSRFSSR